MTEKEKALIPRTALTTAKFVTLWATSAADERTPIIQSHMAREVAEIPQAAARFLQEARPALNEAAKALQARDPVLIATMAHGSSDHAAPYIPSNCRQACPWPRSGCRSPGCITVHCGWQEPPASGSRSRAGALTSWR